MISIFVSLTVNENITIQIFLDIHVSCQKFNLQLEIKKSVLISDSYRDININKIDARRNYVTNTEYSMQNKA